MSYGRDQTSEPSRFYLMHGGPIYRLMVKLRLHGIENAFVGRRSLLLIAVTWVPLLLLSMAQGLALPGAVKVPFIHDFATHVRLLVVLPLLFLTAAKSIAVEGLNAPVTPVGCPETLGVTVPDPPPLAVIVTV